MSVLMLAQTDGLAAESSLASAQSMSSLLAAYWPLLPAAFVVSLLATPLVRSLAFRIDAIDRPDIARKEHKKPVAYMGGLAVFAGLIVAISLSYVLAPDVPANFVSVPLAIIIGMVAVTFTGLADDLWGWDPRLKIAGQLVAAAALAVEEVGTKVAAGIIVPIAQMFDESLNAAGLVFQMSTPMGVVSFDLVYWVGIAIIAIFVLGGCNSANLIDGLDGLLSGVTAIIAIGLLVISLLMVTTGAIESVANPEAESLAGARIVICLAVAGAVLGFLPYNFNPATIFLGDCGSLLLGYCSIVVILMLGDEGKTHLVVCGLIVFSIPIVDTVFAIVRRKLSGVSMSSADNQHLHHKLLRHFGSVKKAVLSLYGMGIGFAVFGAGLAWLVLETSYRVRHLYVVSLLFYIGMILVAFWLSRRQPAMAKKNESPANEGTKSGSTSS
ncbi:MAG: MraY family glycosyltransferase [Planctomycetota bacterium]|nr:MraY family glycosyltransferase [Planctomycetota bacterium]